MIVSAWNPPVEELEKTYLAAYVPAATSALAVKNSDRFVNNKMIMIGNLGYEQTEILTTVVPANSTTVNVASPTVFAHNIDDPIYLLRYDRIRFFSSPSVSGTKTQIADVLIDVTNEEEKTYYEDVGAPTTTYYWVKYRNSITGEETEYSDFIRADGVDEESIGAAVERAARRLKDPGFNLISPDMYIDFANEVNDDLTPQTEKPYNFLHTTVMKDRVAGQNYIDLDEDYEKFDYFIVRNTLNGTLSTKPLIPMPYRQFVQAYDSSTVGNNILTRIALDPGGRKILLKPTPRTDLADAYEIGYWAEFRRIKDFSDIIQTPSGTIYYYKFLAEGYSIKAERDPSFAGLAQKYEQKYSNHVVMLQRMNRKDAGSPRSFNDSQRLTSLNQTPRRRYTL